MQTTAAELNPGRKRKNRKTKHRKGEGAAGPARPDNR
jgi:hypothetical protein